MDRSRYDIYLDGVVAGGLFVLLVALAREHSDDLTAVLVYLAAAMLLCAGVWWKAEMLKRADDA